MSSVFAIIDSFAAPVIRPAGELEPAYGLELIFARKISSNVCKDALAREQITHSELVEALRREGCASLTKVRYAILENDGHISVGLRCHR